MANLFRVIWPPVQLAFRKAFHAQPEALTIINQDLQSRSSAVSENK